MDLIFYQKELRQIDQAIFILDLELRLPEDDAAAQDKLIQRYCPAA